MQVHIGACVLELVTGDITRQPPKRDVYRLCCRPEGDAGCRRHHSIGASYAQVALTQQRIGTERLGGTTPHHLAFGNDVMTVSNAAQGRDMLINEENRQSGIFQMC